MNLVSWIKGDDGPPDSWTSDRSRRATLVAYMSGDIGAAKAYWSQDTRLEFERWLAQHGHRGAGDGGESGGRGQS